ncbi:hypothetical protein [Thermosulfuriphilus sp.]
MARRVAFIKKIKTTRKNVILVDAGDSLAFWPTLSPLQLGMARRKAWALAQIYRQLGYVAIGLGRRDLGIPLEELKNIAIKVPLLSANLANESGQILFRRTKIVEIEGIKIGFFALTAPVQKEGLRALDPLKTARQAVASLQKEGANLIVCLANLGEDGDEDLADEIPGISLILDSGPGIQLYRPEEVEKTFIFRPHPKGKSVGIITLTFHQKELEAISHRLYLLRAKEYPEDEETATWLREEGLLPQ